MTLQHAWDEPIGQFITCLKRSGKKGPFWVCAFSIYQSDGEGDSPTISEQLGDDPSYGPFATVLKGAESMVAVVTVECDIYILDYGTYYHLTPQLNDFHYFH